MDVYTTRNYYEAREFSWWGHDIKGPLAEPVRVEQTVAGLSFMPASEMKIKAALYYKTTDGHLEMNRVHPKPDNPDNSYLALTNIGETTAKGLELGLEYQKQGFIAWLNYTLSDVKGYASYPRSNASVFDHYNETIDHKTEPPVSLDFNQRHRINALLGYAFDHTAGKWLRNTSAFLLFRFNSGHDYTLYEGSGFG
jgi:hypothetical protein